MQRFLLSISILLFSLFSMVVRAQEFVASDQQPLRDSIGCKMKYATAIEKSKGYLSGISVLARESDVYRGVMFNEFGITALEFTYHPSAKKVKLVQVIKMLDKWYIRRVLKKDLRCVVENLLKGISTYEDEKYHIKYVFSLMYDSDKHEVTEENPNATEE